VNWSEWSTESVRLMQDRNAAWVKEFRLENATYRWDIDTATLILEKNEVAVAATICLVGTTSEAANSFLWSWGNSDIPTQHKDALEVVRQFGGKNDLSLLVTPDIPGGRPEALECMCIAARIQKALGTFTDQVGDVGVYFTILHFQPIGSRPRADG
jgi:hypothetical protein